MSNIYYAHTLANEPPEKWELLEDHLCMVAELAEEFGLRLGWTNWGLILGYCHDLGKYSVKFQNYLKSRNDPHIAEVADKVDHSTAGARYVVKHYPGYGQLLAYAIAGHHAGLPDPVETKSGLQERLNTKVIEEFEQYIQLEELKEKLQPSIPFKDKASSTNNFSIAFFTRMLFSCLVDADFLATEQFMNEEQSKLRPQSTVTIADMAAHLDTHLKKMAEDPRHDRSSIVYQSRQEILKACVDASSQSPGFFSLTVPTGGGKTFSSLAFGLHHARQHQLDRVIYAIPFTSIIEQTASVFRGVFDSLGEEIVLEHHSNLDPDHVSAKARLAAENWDTPLVVTTNVQLYESLFANKTSACRKLHRMANSVIILDEAQTLPIDYLIPCLAALKELVTNYNCTIVLCTATQPAVQKSEDFPIGLEGIREIISQPETLYRQLKRVEVQHDGPMTMDDLSARLASHEQCLCIVNTRPIAAQIYRQLESLGLSENLFHLSTNMCGQHRLEQLQVIRERLRAGQPCVVISTQLIEAGVDVDFPVVYRQLIGLDSIAQAAGRCNREGKRPSATVHVFELEGHKTPPIFKDAVQSISQMIKSPDSPLKDDWLSLEAMGMYFGLYYWSKSSRCDAKSIMGNFTMSSGKPFFKFKTTAKDFRLIEEASETVIVPYTSTQDGRKSGSRLLDEVRRHGLNRTLQRRLQRFGVGIRPQALQKMLGGDIVEVMTKDGLPTGVYELLNKNCYDPRIGFDPERAGILGVDQSIF